MKKIKLALSFIAIICIIMPVSIADDYLEEKHESVVVNADVSNMDFQILSRHVAVYERNSKTFLFEKASDEQCAMASTTKIMTCTLILENCNLDDTVIVSQKAADTGGSRLGLTTDSAISVKDLLYGLMLCSGNDAAIALAEHCSGSVERFAELMNSKALQLGLSSTHFVTPHGLDNAGHYTTAHDFAILTDYALCNPQFMQIVGTKSYTVTINNSPKTVTNTNELLGVIPEVYGVKTGYTSQAGRCLITAAKQDNLDIIVIVFGADTKNIRTNDSANLINYTLSTYTVINAKELILAKYNDYITHILPYTNIEKMSQPLQPQLDESFTEYYAIKKDDQDKIEVSLDDYDLKAPIKKDQPVAKITVNLNNHPIISTNIRSQTLITSTTPKQYLYHFLTHYKQYFKA